MTDVLITGLKVIGLGALLSIPGIAFGFWMEKRHEGPNLWLVTTFVCMFVALLHVVNLSSNVPLWFTVFIAVFITALAYKVWPFEEEEAPSDGEET